MLLLFFCGFLYPHFSNHSKLGAILRECLGSLTCRAVVMIHVSNAHARYAETLAALQLGARVHRLRRSRRLKVSKRLRLDRNNVNVENNPIFSWKNIYLISLENSKKVTVQSNKYTKCIWHVCSMMSFTG